MVSYLCCFVSLYWVFWVTSACHVGPECALEGFFHAGFVRLGEELHASGYCLICFLESGPFPNFHGEYPTLPEDLYKNEDVAGIGDGISSLGS